jgi:hypothetical protein
MIAVIVSNENLHRWLAVPLAGRTEISAALVQIARKGVKIKA